MGKCLCFFLLRLESVSAKSIDFITGPATGEITANISVVCGKKSFAPEQIVENIQTAIDSIGKARPEVFKGRYVKSMAISASMSPSVKLEASTFNNL